MNKWLPIALALAICAPNAAGQRGRGPMIPGSFHVLVFGQ